MSRALLVDDCRALCQDFKLRYLVTFHHAEGVLASDRYGKPEWREECLAALHAELAATGHSS